MIDVKSLRIGNIVGDPHNDGTHAPVIIVDLYGDNKVSYKTKEGETCIAPTGELEGIPITEEWLIRFGFQRFPLPYQSEHFHRLPNGFEVMICGDGKIRRIITFAGAVGYSMQGGLGIPSVHDLQNLYFALTGEELKLKP